jgi:hypothetical protein
MTICICADAAAGSDYGHVSSDVGNIVEDCGNINANVSDDGVA